MSAASSFGRSVGLKHLHIASVLGGTFFKQLH